MNEEDLNTTSIQLDIWTMYCGDLVTSKQVVEHANTLLESTDTNDNINGLKLLAKVFPKNIKRPNYHDDRAAVNDSKIFELLQSGPREVQIEILDLLEEIPHPNLNPVMENIGALYENSDFALMFQIVVTLLNFPPDTVAQIGDKLVRSASRLSDPDLLIEVSELIFRFTWDDLSPILHDFLTAVANTPSDRNKAVLAKLLQHSKDQVSPSELKQRIERVFGADATDRLLRELGELGRPVRLATVGNINREAAAINAVNGAPRSLSDETVREPLIPAEFLTEPISLAEAAARMGLAKDNSPKQREAGAKAIKRMMYDGKSPLKHKRVGKKYVFDKRMFPNTKKNT
jgi:hypothetical protein